MILTYKKIKSLNPCYSDKRLTELLPFGKPVILAIEGLLSLPKSDARWLVSRLMNRDKLVLWANNSAYRANKYAAAAAAAAAAYAAAAYAAAAAAAAAYAAADAAADAAAYAYAAASSAASASAAAAASASAAAAADAAAYAAAAASAAAASAAAEHKLAMEDAILILG